MVYNNIGQVYCFQGQYSASLENYNKALKIYRSKFGKSHPDVAIIHNNIGNAYFDQGNYFEALKNHKKAFESGKDVCDEESIDTFIINIYNDLMNMPDHEKGKRKIADAYRIWKKQH